MNRILRKILHGICFLLLLALACAVFGYIVMRLWNWLMPMIFGLRLLTYWQAVGLLLLSKLLLGGFHRHGGRRGCGPGRGRGMRRREWKRHMRERFANMTPEERERFRAGMRGGRGFPPRGFPPFGGPFGPPMGTDANPESESRQTP